MSVLDLIPNHSSTRCLFAQKNDGVCLAILSRMIKYRSDGSFLGCVVWNEFDGMGYIGEFLRLAQ